MKLFKKKKPELKANVGVRVQSCKDCEYYQRAENKKPQVNIRIDSQKI